MKRTINMRKSIAWLLLAICLQWLLPRELWHELSHHHDTDDHGLVGAARLNFSEQHEHCLVLELSLPPVVHEETQEVNFEHDYYCAVYISETPEPVSVFLNEDNSRGPPSLFI